MDHTSDAFYVVIAIDFGTSRSGFAYAFQGKEPIEVNAHYDWPGRRVQRYPKTATRILYDPKKQVVAWGYKAKDDLAKIRRDDKDRINKGQKPEAPDCHLFEEFKLLLYDGEKEPRQPFGLAFRLSNLFSDFSRSFKRRPPFIKDHGEEFLVVNIIADYLRVLKEFALERILPNDQRTLHEKKILWCLTVPAIWEGYHKQYMRQAAEQAGLIGTEMSERGRLIFALEPEAAALHCWETSPNIKARRDGTHFMVVDAGGGTVDLAVFKVTADQRLEEIGGSGGIYGSTKVDREFERHIRNLFTDEVIQDLHDEYPLEYLELMARWENAKCSFDDEADDSQNVLISPRLLKILEEKNSDLHKHLVEQGEDEYITLTPEKMRLFFQPALDGILELVTKQFQSLGTQKCDFLYLVGGFASSNLLEKKIRNAFGTRTSVVVPKEPGAAIEMGAVSFALDISLIRSRLARMTYGIGMALLFEPSLDQGRRTKIDKRDGSLLCEGRFQIFVTAGQSININQPFLHSCCPAEADQEEMSIVCYATDRKDVRYLDDKGVRQLGRLNIRRASLSDGLYWEVHVTMFFGRTEIVVEVKDPKTNVVERTYLDYL